MDGKLSVLRKTAARGTAVTQQCQEMFARFWGGNKPPQKKRKKKMLNMSNSKPRELYCKQRQKLV